MVFFSKYYITLRTKVEVFGIEFFFKHWCKGRDPDINHIGHIGFYAKQEFLSQTKNASPEAKRFIF